MRKLHVVVAGGAFKAIENLDKVYTGQEWDLVVFCKRGSDWLARLKSYRKQTSARRLTIETTETQVTLEYAARAAKEKFPEHEVITSAGSSETTDDALAVVVTCHAAYLPFLPACLAAIDCQTHGERVLVLDGCDYTPPTGWKTLRGDWQNPNPGRNAGWRATTAEWIVFWDADDLMPDGYLESVRRTIPVVAPDVGIIYPDIKRGVSQPSESVAAWGYWEQRRCNKISTPSAWLRQAVERAGGWDEELRALDDAALALRITALGWRAKELTATVCATRHELGHWSHNGRGAQLNAMWRNRTFAILTILCDRQDRHLQDWLRWLKNADLPPHVELHAIDSSGNPEFRKRLAEGIESVAHRFERVSIASWQKSGPVEDRWNHARQEAVAEDYNRALHGITTDMVLFVDDDTVPPNDGLRILHEQFYHGSPTGASAGVYPNVRNPEIVCGSTSKEKWVSNLKLADFPATPVEAGYVPGGCTLFAAWALRRCLPFRTAHNGQGISTLAWDNWVSERLRALGFRLFLDGRVRCAHNFSAKHDRSVMTADFPVIFSVVDNCDLLPYFIRHYVMQGATRFICCVFRGGLNPIWPEVARMLHDASVEHELWTEPGEVFNGAADSTFQDTIRQRLEPGTWYVIADLDEFHAVPGFTLRESAVAANADDATVLAGEFADRVTPDGTLPPSLNGARRVEDLFPMVAPVTEVVTGGATKKVLAARSDIPIESGHHTHRGIQWSHTGHAHHFKWWGALREKAAAREASYREQGLFWSEESRRLLAHLDANGGRLAIGTPALPARRVKPA